jgi:hypothetical protein
MGMFVRGKKMSYKKLEPHPMKPKRKNNNNFDFGSLIKSFLLSLF